MRFIIAIAAVLGLAASVRAEPLEHWQNAEPGLQSDAQKAVHDFGTALKPTSVMFVRDGEVIASFGDVGRKVIMQSVRKSLLNALYGIAVAEGRIKLTSTLAELGIDDKPPALTDAEKQATVRNMLMARSGVYHPAAYETPDIAADRPARGSHAPGTFWFYNNWDFNALGTIYQKLTNEDIFESFERRIARPIGMEDFSARDGRYVTEPQSLHRAYPFSLSARDAARFGLLYLNGGSWRGRQIIPAAWIKESSATYSDVTDRIDRGYGYLWWTLRPDQWGAGAISADGNGGQKIAVIPSRRLVVVVNVDQHDNPKGVPTRAFFELVRNAVPRSP